MVEVMKIMATSFYRSHADIVALSTPNPAAGHLQPTPPLGTPGHSRACPGQSLVGSCSLLLVLVCTRFCVCPPRVCIPVLCKFWEHYGGVNEPPPRRLMPYPGLMHPESLPLRQSTADPYLHRRHSDTVLAQSLWGLSVLVCTRFV